MKRLLGAALGGAIVLSALPALADDTTPDHRDGQ